MHIAVISQTNFAHIEFTPADQHGFHQVLSPHQLSTTNISDTQCYLLIEYWGTKVTTSDCNCFISSAGESCDVTAGNNQSVIVLHLNRKS